MKNPKIKILAALLAAALFMEDRLPVWGSEMGTFVQENADLPTPMEGEETTISGNTVSPLEAEEKTQEKEGQLLEEEEKKKGEGEDEPVYASMVLQVGQMSADEDEMPDMAASEILYNQSINLMEESRLRLFTDQEAAKRMEKEYDLAWEILRMPAGAKQGSTTLVDTQDDWIGAETVENCPYFMLQRDTDQDSVFYETVLLSARQPEKEESEAEALLDETDKEEAYDYYIRVTLRIQEEKDEHTAMTTLPVILEQQEQGENPDNQKETDTELEETEADRQQEGTEEEKEQNDLQMQQNSQDSQKDLETETENSMTEETEGKEKQSIPEEDLLSQQEENAVRLSDESVEGEAVQETGESKEAAETLTISKLVLNKTDLTMNTGDTVRLTAVVVPEEAARSIDWTIEEEGVVVFEDSQETQEKAVFEKRIRAVDTGSAVITVSAADETGSVKTEKILIEVVETDAEVLGDKPVDRDGNTIEISDEVWIAGFEKELTYTGAKITQELRVYHKGTLLKEKTDYVLSYKNNLNAAAYNSAKAPSVTITMKGQYSGSRTLYYTIAPRNICEDKNGKSQVMGYDQVVQYSKKLKLPAPTLYFEGKKLTFNKDFVCDYSKLAEALGGDQTQGDAYEEGKVYEYTVNGTGNFCGSFQMRLSVIRDKNLNFEKVTVTLDKKQYEYRGSALTREDVKIVSVKIGKTVLDPGLYDYEVHAENVGTGYIMVFPSDTEEEEDGVAAGYRGFKKINIKVVGDRKIKDAVLGSSWQPEIVFSQKLLKQDGGICQNQSNLLVYHVDPDGEETSEENSGEPLVEGIDYTVRYNNNKKAGTATIIFTGIGRYTGSMNKTYKIVPNTNLSIQWYSVDTEGKPTTVYGKGGAVPQFELREAESGEVLSSKTDYTVKVKNNGTVGTMTCEIIGKGNYKGYQQKTDVQVLAADISEGTLTVADKQYSTKKNAWKSSVSIKDVNGKVLHAGTDYDKNLVYRYAGMETGEPPQPDTIVYVTAYGRNNYAESSITGSYRIFSTNIGKLTIVIDPQEYTGKEVELSQDDIHVYVDQKSRKAGIEIEEPCYEILSYSNNIKAGTAKVTMRGIGGYGGTRTCSFKINKKEYKTTRVTGITLEETSLTMGVGNVQQLAATVMPEEAENKVIVWSSSNAKVASVDSNGVVTALKAGKANITATAQDTGKKAVCKVTVSVIQVTYFTLNATEIEGERGTQYQLLTENVQPENATDSTIEWESGNPAVASVDAKGLVTMNRAGVTTIRVYANKRQFVRMCLVTVTDTENPQPEGTYLTPQMFRESDDADDTEAFNRAIRSLDKDSEGIYVPAGVYYIDAVKGIQLGDIQDKKFIMDSGAVLRATGNSSSSYEILHVNNAQNITISGGKIIGERDSHRGDQGEWGHGIGVYGSSNILIENVDISECWGDGIYLGSHNEKDPARGCSGITVIGCTLHHNRRNNLSIVCGDYVMIKNCSFSSAQGTAPEFGIDIETNNPKDPCEHITISDSVFEKNGQGSIMIVTAANDILISNCTLKGMFVNYAGENVVLKNSQINGEIDARIGVSMEEGTTINDGEEEEDVLIASFCAADDPKPTVMPYNHTSRGKWSCSFQNSNSPSGQVLRMERLTADAQEAGYYLNLKELTSGQMAALKEGVNYRFEYVIKGSGQWGVRTSQTGWYGCIPASDKFSTGYVCYQADAADACELQFYALEKTKGMYLEIDSVNIYEIK